MGISIATLARNASAGPEGYRRLWYRAGATEQQGRSERTQAIANFLERFDGNGNGVLAARWGARELRSELRKTDRMTADLKRFGDQERAYVSPPPPSAPRLSDRQLASQQSHGENERSPAVPPLSDRQLASQQSHGENERRESPAPKSAWDQGWDDFRNFLGWR